MFASVAILEDVANFKWGDVAGAPEPSLELFNIPTQDVVCRIRAQGAYRSRSASLQCRMMREEVCEVASWLIMAGHNMRVKET